MSSCSWVIQDICYIDRLFQGVQHIYELRLPNDTINLRDDSDFFVVIYKSSNSTTVV